MKSKLIFCTSEPSAWTSCQSISTNLLRSYKLAFPGSRVFTLDVPLLKRRSWSSQNYIKEICLELARVKSEQVVFIDWEPAQFELIEALARFVRNTGIKLEFTIHVYADLVLWPAQWAKIGEAMRGLPLRCVFASAKECEISSQFLKEPKGTSFICPFPVDTTHFRYDPKIRQKARQALGLAKNEKLIVYSGRLSQQKNVHLLVKEFRSLAEQYPNPLRMVLVGSFDDMGAAVLGLPSPLGWYFQKMRTALDLLPNNLRDRIQIQGFKSAEEIRDLLNAADLFWSLSTHHNEDFGMAIAEALACGLPSVITDWAGYSSFRQGGLPCELAEVKLLSAGLQIHMAAFRSHSLHLLNAKHGDQDRWRAARLAADRYSPLAVARKLQKLESNHPLSFAGFKRIYKELPKRMHHDLRPGKVGFYSRVYSNYYKSTIY